MLSHDPRILQPHRSAVCRAAGGFRVLQTRRHTCRCHFGCSRLQNKQNKQPSKTVDPKVDVSPRCGVQLLGGMAKGLALLTVDQEYINRFRARPGGQRQRVLWGIQAAGVGLYEGLIGRAVWGLCRGRESRCLQPVLLPAVVTVWWLVWQPAAQGIVVPGYTGLWFAAHSDCRVALTR